MLLYVHNIMFIYFLLFRIASLFNPKARMIVRGHRDTWERLKERPAGKYVWFHAASVGEFEQARPIIERLKKEHPEKKVLVTFFSCSGYEARKDYALADLVLYLPFATRRNARKWLKAIDIEMAVFVKYEFWPAYLKALKKNNIPTYVIAALFRKNQSFFRPFGGGYRRVLKNFTTLFVQDEESRVILSKYGIDNVVVAGDTRFDRVSKILAQEKELPVLMRFTEPEVSPLTVVQPAPKQTIVAGSTWPEDEALLQRYITTHPEVQLVVVPHELNKEHLHYIFNLFEGRFVRYSEATSQNLTVSRTLLVDTMGLLSSIYRFGQVAYVGGGFGEGIHNIVEPAVYGMPVIFGPNYKKFREAHDLIRLGGGFSVKNYAAFEAAMDNALANAQELGAISRDYVQSELGATDKIYSQIWHK